jgi:hypothetical protein
LWHVAAESGGNKVLKYLHKVYSHEPEILQKTAADSEPIHWPNRGKLKECDYISVPEFPDSPLLVAAAQSGSLVGVKWLVSNSSDICMTCERPTFDSNEKEISCATCKASVLGWSQARNAARKRGHEDVLKYFDGVDMHRKCCGMLHSATQTFGSCLGIPFDNLCVKLCYFL